MKELAILQKLLVWKDGEQIGDGWLIIREGKIGDLMLSGKDGKDLPRNEWYQLQWTNERYPFTLTDLIH